MSNDYTSRSFLTADELKSLSSEEVYRYCFINGNKADWDSDFNKEIVNNISNYELLKTLSGEPLSFIKTKLSMILSRWIPTGTKLNPRLLFTLQDILSQDEPQVRDSSLTGKPNDHIRQSCIKLTLIINKAFEYSAGV